MAKPKGVVVTNRPLYSRISYLHQAGAYLAAESQKATESARGPASLETNATSAVLESTTIESKGKPVDPAVPSSRHYLSELRAVSLRTQIRLSTTMRQSICHRCNTLLVDGSTCSVEIKNKSKGGRKEWADVLVRTCKTCNSQKRFPVGAKRQKRRPLRVVNKEQPISLMSGDEDELAELGDLTEKAMMTTQALNR